MLLPGDPHHHAESIFVGEVQQPARWHCVGANGIQSVGGHLAEIGLGSRGVWIVIPVGSWTEGPVGHTSDPEPLPGVRQEPAGNFRPLEA